jgi:hypothetical protein
MPVVIRQLKSGGKLRAQKSEPLETTFNSFT